MMCGCMMASKPIGGAMSNEVDWDMLNSRMLGTLFDKFVHFIFSKDLGCENGLYIFVLCRDLKIVGCRIE